MMKMRALWQTLAIVSLTLLFVLVRIGTIEHSARFGSKPHQHDGKICTISLTAHDDEDSLLPTDTSPDTACITRYATLFNYAAFATYQQGAAPLTKATARSPPTA